MHIFLLFWNSIMVIWFFKACFSWRVNVFLFFIDCAYTPSTLNRWALTHPLSISEYERLKKQLKPDFLDMVPWYSGWVLKCDRFLCLKTSSRLLMAAIYRTSADLFKTVFDLLVSVTLFVGRFDMRMMQVYRWKFCTSAVYITYSIIIFIVFIGLLCTTDWTLRN